MEILEFTFRSFWHFIGVLILAEGVIMVLVHYAFRAYIRKLRNRNITARGWPPPHLDADGDWKEED